MQVSYDDAVHAMQLLNEVIKDDEAAVTFTVITNKRYAAGVPGMSGQGFAVQIHGTKQYWEKADTLTEAAQKCIARFKAEEYIDGTIY